MVKIAIGRYLITSDRLQYIVNEQRVNQKTGEDYLTPISYHPRLEDLIEWLLRHEQRDTDAEDLKTLIVEQKRLMDWLRSVFRTLVPKNVRQQLDQEDRVGEVAAPKKGKR